MPRLTDYETGEEFFYQSLPHEDRGGYSYNIQMSSDPKDIVHFDTKPGTVLRDDDIRVLRAYYRTVRTRK